MPPTCGQQHQPCCRCGHPSPSTRGLFRRRLCLGSVALSTQLAAASVPTTASLHNAVETSSHSEVSDYPEIASAKKAPRRTITRRSWAGLVTATVSVIELISEYITSFAFGNRRSSSAAAQNESTQLNLTGFSNDRIDNADDDDNNNSFGGTPNVSPRTLIDGRQRQQKPYAVDASIDR